jgi:hypothetical protein
VEVNISRAHNKLLKSGYLPQKQNEDYEIWIDVKHKGAAISFYKNPGDSSIDVFKSHGTLPDRPEFDDWNSYYTPTLTEAIRVSRVNIKS